MRQRQACVLDLTKIEGSGDFSCPHCGAAISPDDCTEKVYSILEAKVNKKGLAELVIRCNRCTSQIHLTGFSLLQELPETIEEKNKDRREDPKEYMRTCDFTTKSSKD